MWTRRPWNICKSAFAAASTKKLQLQLSSNGFRVPMCLKEFGCHIISPCLAYGARTTFLACLASSHGSSFLFADDCCLLVSHILRIGNRCSLCPKKFFKFCSLNAGYAGVIVFFTCICVYIYIYTLTTDFIIDLYLLLLYGIFKSPKLAASGVHCSSHRGAWREASVCQGESQRSSCHEGSYVSGSKAIQNISKLSLGCLMVMFTLMHPHFFEIFNQLNQFEVRRRRRCKRWVFAMESVARPLKP